MSTTDVADPVEPVNADAPRLGRKRDHTRDPEILNAALDVLAETGYDRMTVDMVATRARAGKATLYRRWPSKAELVVDAVACMKPPIDLETLPDTGTLRGDLVAMIRPPSIADAERKLQIMAGVASVVARAPELAQALHAAIVEPRARINRIFFQRAIDRGEIRADIDMELLSTLQSSVVVHRTLLERKAIDRDFLVHVIDEVILPAAGVRAG